MRMQTIDLTDGGRITISEAAEDGSLVREENDDPRVTWKFYVRGADDASTAYNALMAWLRSNFDDGDGGIASYNIPLETVRISTTASPFVYVAECTFHFPSQENDSNINNSSYNLPDVEPADYSFDTSGGSAHITHAIATLGAACPDGSNPIDFGNLIGPREDGTADGVDVVVPTMNFSIAISVPKNWFNVDYRLTIAAATGCVNSTAWNGFAAGNVLFRGVSARVTWLSWTDNNGNACKDWYWRAQYNFSASPSSTFNVGGASLYKRGFDVVSRVSESYAAENGQTISAVAQVNIYQVYPEFNFYNLCLPLPD